MLFGGTVDEAVSYLLVRVGWSDNFPQKRDDGPHLGEREDVAVTEALCTGFFVDEWTGRG